MTDVRAFIVRANDDYEATCALVFAVSARRAKAIAWARGHLEAEDFIDLRVKRLPDADKLALATEGVVGDPKVLRSLGWHGEDERACDSCGLAPMDMEEFAVCDDCGQCPECGCTCEVEISAT